MKWSWRRMGFLAALVVVAHFVPPERSAPAPDEMSIMSAVHENGVGPVLNAAVGVKQRPLGHSLFVVRTAWAWNQPWLGVALLLASALLATFAAYALFDEL